MVLDKSQNTCKVNATNFFVKLFAMMRTTRKLWRMDKRAGNMQRMEKHVRKFSTLHDMLYLFHDSMFYYDSQVIRALSAAGMVHNAMLDEMHSLLEKK